MGGGASASAKEEISKASPEEIKAAMDALPEDEKAKVLKAVAGAGAAPAAAGAASSGPVDVSALTVVAKDNKGLLDQPAEPKFKGALCQIYVRDAPYGGSDKSSNGHRYDSIPFANGMINAGMSCQLVHYVHDQHDKFFEVVKKFMGAKDALCKVANLNIGLEDTLAYYDDASFAAGFKKTMKFQPRVIKQNRGSSGEGIWIINLKSGDYCAAFGDAEVGDDDELILMEANDNHVENHTVKEFISWCINGRVKD